MDEVLSSGPMPSSLNAVLARQMEAALAMLADCVRVCPGEHWDLPIAKYPFWQVAYHALCFVDCYLSPSNEAFHAELAERAASRAGGRGGKAGGLDLHPAGINELEDEYPSRRFERGELLAYVDLCRGKIGRVLGEEGGDALEGASGFSWLAFTRAELHMYNIRHVQHHAGQLGAALRRVGVEPGRWVKSGWRE